MGSDRTCGVCSSQTTRRVASTVPHSSPRRRTTDHFSSAFYSTPLLFRQSLLLANGLSRDELGILSAKFPGHLLPASRGRMRVSMIYRSKWGFGIQSRFGLHRQRRGRELGRGRRRKQHGQQRRPRGRSVKLTQMPPGILSSKRVRRSVRPPSVRSTARVEGGVGGTATIRRIGG
ncbi:hypothetical protein B0H17DRAFT_1187638 [Mycena rosella]|uniref:Uncharacterized protein n=1 Tax=Mycena rosella TaxID=1033263 RepID=A0AAD7FPE7_MYCRO|nr:hypothetical protein B0H17DRAFT_1187638 [Mycena rosella]